MPADRTPKDRILDALDAATDWTLDVLDAIRGRRLVVRVRTTAADGSTVYVRVDELGS